MPFHKKFYMVDLAAICWALWKKRNNICFENKICRFPTEVICLSAFFITYWAGLHKPEDKMELEIGAEALKNTALFFHPREAPPKDTGLVFLQ